MKKTAANIKKSNYHMITDFAAGRNLVEMEGNKLRALYKLIQTKGQPITQAPDETLLNMKCLEIAPGEFVAIKRTGPKDRFYPCCIKMYSLVNL